LARETPASGGSGLCFVDFFYPDIDLLPDQVAGTQVRHQFQGKLFLFNYEEYLVDDFTHF
jgi:hypothetical protein